MIRELLLATLTVFWACGCSPNALDQAENAAQETAELDLDFVLEQQSWIEDHAPYWEALPFERLSIERTGCYGTCPVYRADFFRGGEVRYVGGANAPRAGEFRGNTSLYAYVLLCSLVERGGLLDMQDSYSASWTDDETITIEIESASGVKTISDYGRQAPPEFQAFRALFDEFIEEVRLSPVQ